MRAADRDKKIALEERAACIRTAREVLAARKTKAWITCLEKDLVEDIVRALEARGKGRK